MDLQLLLDALTSKALREGVVVTITLTIVSFVAGLVLALGLALMRGSRFRAVRAAAWTYIWVFRAVPTLVQLLFVWNALPQLIPALRGPGFTAFIAAAIALALNEAAYAAEIIRGGLLSIDDGQRLAARALGMRPGSVFRKVVAPQLVRVIIPPTANDFITMLKLTSLASVISLQEVMAHAQAQVSITFRFAEWYTAAAIYYLVLVSIFMAAQAWFERRYVWTSQGADRPRRSILGGMGLR
ncbi:MAG TPA: amino acid ABC transporter permease [Candidatus Limnocylindria bacterium]|nr:amino acid ABC transporter permease [Candidatus Limnocylindria bacterium]